MTTTERNTAAPVLVIGPPKRLFYVGFKELWDYRELVYFFVWRDLKVRYKQTMVGVFWVMFQPLMTTIIFTIFFGRLAKIPSDGLPYPVFVFSGLLFWNYFSFSLSEASNSAIANTSIIKKIYFPRLILTMSACLVGLIDFSVAFILFLGMMFYFKCTIHWGAFLYLPLLLGISFLSAFGLGSFLSAVNVKYRDVRYALPFFIQLLLFLTPIIYPVSMMNEKYRWLMNLNPMSGVIETARATFFGSAQVHVAHLLISAAMAVVFFIAGVVYFRKVEQFFADII